MEIEYLNSIWNSALNEEPENIYSNPKEALNYNNSLSIWQDGFRRAYDFNFSTDYTVLDVGAGPGTLCLPLSGIVKKVIALEPSEEMRKYLNRHIEDKNIKNIEVVHKKWQETNFCSCFDVVIASYSLAMRDISDVILKINKASRQHCYIFWFSGMTSWEKEQQSIYQILGQRYKLKLNKANIIYEMLYQMKLYPDIRILKATNFDRFYKTIENALAFIKSRHRIDSNLYDDAIINYINKTYKKINGGYMYRDDTKYTEIYWEKRPIYGA